MAWWIGSGWYASPKRGREHLLASHACVVALTNGLSPPKGGVPSIPTGVERSGPGGSIFFRLIRNHSPVPPRRPTPREEERALRALLEQEVADEGFDLVAVQILVLDGRRTLRVSVDRPGGVNLGHCTRLSHALSALLDVADPLTGPFDLEVSSPGMERPVQRLADYEKFKGYRVRLRMAKGSGRQRWTGTLAGVQDEHVLLSCDGTVHALPFAEIERANLVLDLDEYRRVSGIDPEDKDPWKELDPHAQ